MKSKIQHNRNHGITLGTHERADANHLETMARELSLVANRKLRNGCLDGCIRGYEDEIRQDAILLALRWQVRGLSNGGASAPKGADWNPCRDIARALHFTKLRYLTRLKPKDGSPNVMLEATITTKHPACIDDNELPAAHRVEMVREGIAEAVRKGHISPENACVTELVLCDGTPVAEAAGRLGCHRSAIYQHLTRTRPVLRKIIGHIEIPFIS